MNIPKYKVIIFIGVFGLVLFFILGFLGVIPIFKPADPNAKKQVPLVVWGTENGNDMTQILAGVSSRTQNFSIEYKQINEKNYESTLLNSLAVGKGPDIFMVHRSWLFKHGDKIVPAGDTQINIAQLRQTFPDIVEKDFTYNQKVYALPLYLDSLALFYNKDIFNSKSIALPPATWDDLKNLIPYLTELDSSNQIKKSAIAIGGSNKSVDKSSDILALLMFQFNSSFIDSQNYIVNFDSTAVEALNFYLQFANPTSKYYTWNNDLNNSLDSFASGDTAMMINYAKQAQIIKKKNPFLNFTIAPVPQFNLSKPSNFSDYWGMAVSTQSKYPTDAWDFIIAFTAHDNFIEEYIKNTKLPPATRTLINKYIGDPDLSTFAKQSLSSTSISGLDTTVFAQSLSNAIESVLNGKLNSYKALEQAREEINGN